MSHEDARIQVFIDDLASSEATIRDTAERELRALGPVAHAALREAAVHGAPEVRLRARAILRDPLGTMVAIEATRRARAAVVEEAEAKVRPYEAGTTDFGVTTRGTTTKGTIVTEEPKHGTTNEGTTDRGMTRMGASGYRAPTPEQSISLSEFGVTIRDLDGIQSRDANLRGRQGAYVLGVTPGSKAARLGLRRGDFVTAVEVQSVRNARDLGARLHDARNEDSVSLTVVRAGEVMALRPETKP